MKVVELVQFKTEEVLVLDSDDHVMHYTQELEPARVNGTYEFIPEIIEEVNVKIERVVKDGVESYFSVTLDVWEKLCLFQNPVTVKTLIDERDRFKKDSRFWHGKYLHTESKLLYLEKHCNEASFLKRLKWLIYGFKR